METRKFIQFVNHSEVKFVCVRIPSVSTWVRHWSLRRKIYGYLIGPYPTFNRHCTANPYANPYADASGSTKWRAVIGLCVKQPLYATTLLHVPFVRLEFWLVRFLRTCTCMLRCNSNGHIELGDRFSDGPQAVFACQLNPHFCAFGNTLCGMSPRGSTWDC